MARVVASEFVVFDTFVLAVILMVQLFDQALQSAEWVSLYLYSACLPIWGS